MHQWWNSMYDSITGRSKIVEMVYEGFAFPVYLSRLSFPKPKLLLVNFGLNPGKFNQYFVSP